MRKLGWAFDTLPGYGQEFNETRDLMGKNFYPYGLKASAASYDAAIRYTYELGARAVDAVSHARGNGRALHAGSGGARHVVVIHRGGDWFAWRLRRVDEYPRR